MSCDELLLSHCSNSDHLVGLLSAECCLQIPVVARLSRSHVNNVKERTIEAIVLDGQWRDAPDL